MSKTLVAYFSASGTTKRAAERLARAANADLFEIRPSVPYAKADLDWMDKRSRSTVEMNDPASRPEIAEKLPNMAEYDKVFLGYPIWWYVAPRIMESFVESYDFSGKTLIPFATSGGSGIGKTAADLKNSARGAVIRDGKLLNGRQTRESLAAWVSSLSV